jgi:hypothetical protein
MGETGNIVVLWDSRIVDPHLSTVKGFQSELFFFMQ